MFACRSREVGELLCRRRLVTEARWRELAAAAAPAGRVPVELLAETGELARADFLAALAADLGLRLVEDPPLRLPGATIALLPAVFARRHGLVPWRRDGAVLEVLCLDPFAAGDLGELEFALGCKVHGCVADPAIVAALLREHFGGGEGVAGLLDRGPAGEAAGPAEPGAAELVALAGQAPVVRYVDDVLAQAVRERASDIHFEPFEREYRVRCRVDGALRDWPPPPAPLALPVASRLKVLANLDIAERRTPQDGRIRLEVGGRPVDLRVSTLPTQHGESVVLRVLDRAQAAVGLEALGLSVRTLADLRAVIRRPSGIVVVTGPTGSGKTTTLYSCLREINDEDTKLLTVEDPVEYELEGVMQVAVNPAAGLTFAAALRAFLRQDPDVVLVGEIRDTETARVAIQAALTGHLVLTTLHTNDAAGAVARLTELGVEPYLVAASLEAVLAQRLVRRICPDCACEQLPDAETRARLAVGGGAPAGLRFFGGAGCPQCQGTGYRGRRGLFELLRVDEAMRDLIARGAGAQELRDHARARGMQTLRAGGLAALAARETTPEEVLKYT